MLLPDRFLAWCLAAAALAAVSCEGGGHHGRAKPPSEPEVVLEKIVIAPKKATVPLGAAQAFTATGVFSDKTKKDLSKKVKWRSSKPEVAKISNKSGKRGLASSVAAGTTTITATMEGVKGTAKLTVTAPALVSIEVTPANPSIAKGRGLSFSATGTFTDGSKLDMTEQATWTSSDGRVASISNAAGSRGRATALAEGQTTIAASVGAVSGSTTLTVTAPVLVSIDVTPTNPAIAVQTELQFQATGLLSDNSTQNLTAQASWTSSDARVASISDAAGSKGLARGLAVGESTIAASVGAVSGSTRLTVRAAQLVSIDVTPSNPSISAGTDLQFAATGNFDNQTTQDLTEQVAWASSNGAAASISNAAGSRGRATGLAEGQTTISATLGAVSGSTTLTVKAARLLSIEVTPANPSIAKGTTLQFTATGRFENNTTQDLTLQVTWTSSDTSVATISDAGASKGVATAAGVGQTTITARLDAVSGSTNLTVTPALLVSIAVTPANPSIMAGQTQAFTATGSFEGNLSQNLTAQVTWTSSDPAVAAISNAAPLKGIAMGAAPGSTTITATLDQVSGSTTLTVTRFLRPFVRCETNEDGRDDIADGVRIVDHLFHAAQVGCLSAADCNDDSRVNIADALYCFDYQFRNGPRPPVPFPSCGTDPTEDSLTCESFLGCR